MASPSKFKRFWQDYVLANDVANSNFVMMAISSLMGLLARDNVAIVSTYGWFGVAVVAFLFWAAFNVIASIRRANQKARRRQPDSNSILARVARWKGWSFVVGAAVLVFTWSLVDVAPKLPVTMRGLELRFPIATYEELKSDKIVGRTVILTEAAESGTFLIKGKTFENCDIIGPALVGLFEKSGFLAEQNSFAVAGLDEPDVESMLFENNSSAFVAAYGIVDCNFVQCTFHQIAIAASGRELERIRQGITISTYHESKAGTEKK